MMPPIDSSSEFSSLMSNLVEGGLTPSQFDQLAQILEADPAARAVYRDHLSVHAMLYWRWHQQASETHQQSPRDSSSNATSDDWTAPQSDSELSPPLPGIDSPTSSFFGILSHAAHGTIGFFSQELPFALLIATLVTCLGLLAGSVVYVSHHKQLADNGSAAKPTLPPVQFNLDYVGRVTGMVDVQWSDDQTATVHGANVFLGRKFALASGLMEITYDTGAKVILQGPCTYQAESKTGGFLSVGKLTTRVEQRGQARPNLPSPGHRPAGLVGGRGAVGEGSKHFQTPASEINPKSQITKSQIPNPSSLVPLHSPLFTIKTPTAVVTDLGTEFGVEVDKKGTTTSHVFCGVVEIQSVAQDSRQGRTIRLSENESACVKRKSKSQELTVRRVAVDPLTFVRCKQFLELARERKPGCFDRWRAYSEQLRRDPSLLAYYDFQQKEGLPAVLPNVAANGDHALDGVVANATWSTGRMPGKHALLFQNPSDCVRFNLPQSTSDLTLAAWVCFDAFDSSFHAASGLLMSESQNVPAGIRWQVWHRDGCLSLSLPGDGIAASPAIDHKTHRWVHLASVYDRSAHQVRSFVDGHCVGSGDLQRNNPVTIGTARIGNRDSQTSQFEFRGLMDELVIVGRTLTADEIRQMCREGQPQTVCQPASRSLVRSLAKPIGPGVELVRNGGFEAAHPGGVNGGWFHDADGWDVVTAPFQAYTGSPHSGQFRGAVWDGGVGTQKQFYANGFDPTVARLAFHGWAKAEVAGGVARVSVTVGNMTGDVFIVHNTRSFTIAETTWTEVAGELTVQHGRGTNLTNYVEIRLTGEGTAPQKAGQFDDLSLVTVEKKSSRQ